MKKRITLSDVAKRANVSRATASLVVRGSSKVAEETRARVQSAMNELNYVYHRGAATLRTNQSHSIALLVNNIMNPFFVELMIGVEATTDRNEYALLLSHTAESLEKQAGFIEKSREYGVDGILICPTVGSNEETIMQLNRTAVPYVMVARYVENALNSVNYVGADNYGGSKQATQNLIERGYQNIAFIGGPADSSARKDRFAGYRDALSEAGIKLVDAYMPFSPTTREGGYKALESLLALAKPPDAAVCFNDIVAFGVLMALESHGIKAGDSFGIVGFDDLSDAQFFNPALTTVAVSPGNVGRNAVELLLSLIDDPSREPQQIILDSRLVIRQT